MFPKGLGDLSSMLKQAMQMKGKIERLKEELAGETVEGSAGGGMVKVVLNGKFEALSVKVDPEVVNKDEPEMLETLIQAAVNEALTKVQELMKSRMTEITGGVDIPGLTC